MYFILRVEGRRDDEEGEEKGDNEEGEGRGYGGVFMAFGMLVGRILWLDGTANYFLIALVCLAVGGRRLLGRHVLS